MWIEIRVGDCLPFAESAFGWFIAVTFLQVPAREEPPSLERFTSTTGTVDARRDEGMLANEGAEHGTMPASRQKWGEGTV